jgi:hypothetical protein
MKKGLAILLILSSTIYAGHGDDAVGIATYEDLSQEFTWLFNDSADSPTATRPRSQSNTDSISPKTVTRVKSSSSFEENELPPTLLALALKARKDRLEAIRTRSSEALLANSQQQQ